MREEIDHVREGKHGASSPQQAIAIGLSKARRAGIPLPPPEPGEAPAATRVSVIKALRALRTKRANQPPKKHGNIPL